MISKNTESLLAYRYLKGIGKKNLNALAIAAEKSGGSVQDCFQHCKLNVFSTEEIEAALNKAKMQIETAELLGHMIISRLDSEYPNSLKVVDDAPPILFCAGNLELLTKDIITIIGTRSPTEHGISIADRVTKWFSENGWVIASGLAKGIDTVAHESCLEADGKTISILAHGLEKVYPAQNKNLAKRIIQQDGLLVTEYSYNSYVGKSNFIERDRIQAALAKAVILVQSDLVGGSLHASRAILDYQRYLIVLGQSTRDISNGEDKISANMLLINGKKNEKAKLLKTTEDMLRNLIVLPDKRYFAEVNDLIKGFRFNSIENESGDNISLF
ncbi:DNA-protecting protein DprA [Vibrio cholerae]|uniref:DNA-processing protein DprA n=1 Tax=Vibrio cholerae TaxID=666 RepID=UPI000B48A7DA|nr:DNA-processing protein DprA [Vibrio cholerae]EGR1859445.1 DNA-processing protein DprA [Vibrio cholerae]EIE9609921.1 DNA-protecting protein DprA [Vibrio cholerae]EJL3954329.1 DNA-protecting protein DprA [Vibrio cholerae]EJM7231116.1 DNA-protecting protein DprA [Vibrio cholerae]MDV2389141.1 DNA-processing protein DprA [Vibrio cholerae]